MNFNNEDMCFVFIENYIIMFTKYKKMTIYTQMG